MASIALAIGLTVAYLLYLIAFAIVGRPTKISGTDADELIFERVKTIGSLWTLRCETRENMLDWLRQYQPDALVRHRLEVPNGHPKAGEL